jgi:hypothetical protein
MDDYSVLRIQRNEMSNFKLMGGTAPPKIESSLVAIILKDPRGESSDWIRKFISANWKVRSALAAVACASKVLTEKYPSKQFTDLGKGGYCMILHAYNSQTVKMLQLIYSCAWDVQMLNGDVQMLNSSLCGGRATSFASLPQSLRAICQN